MTRVDAHVHLWDLQRCDYPWLTPALAPLHRSFSPDEAWAELHAAGFDAGVLVQAADDPRDTRLLLDIAAEHAWVAGVVGWLPLAVPDDVEAALANGPPPGLAGVRHLTHDDPDPAFLLRPTVLRSLRLLAEAGLTLDVPDAWPHQLPQVAALADAVPDLAVVVDHLGKPPLDEPALAEWAGVLREVARRPRVTAKLSGLSTVVTADRWTADVVRPALDVALDAFGPDRLMYGGDWPMPLLVPGGSYGRVWSVVGELVGTLSPAEQEAVLGGTANRVYRLELPTPRR